MLTKASVTNLAQVQASTPSLSISSGNTNKNGLIISMRGQTQTSIIVTVDPAVGIYVDGVSEARAMSAGLANMVDIERVEVLKGPQGTLFGRNTTGGAISISYKQPTGDFEGLVNGRLDQYGRMTGNAVLNLPIAGEDLAMRVVGSLSRGSGFGRNLVYGGNSFGDLHDQSIRGTLRWQAVDNLEITLRGDYMTSRSRDSSVPFKLLTVQPGGTFVNNGVRPQTGLTLAQYLERYNAGLGFWDVRHNSFSRNKDKVWGVSGTVIWDIGDLQMKSITAYRKASRNSLIDLDGTDVAVYNTVNIGNTGSFTEELNLSGKLFDDRMDFIVGAFYARESGTDVAITNTFGSPTARLTDGSVVNSSIAGYVQSTFRVTDALSVTGGLRYTRDTRELEARNRVEVPLGTFSSCATPTIYRNPTANNPCRAPFKGDWSAVSYTASIDYKPASDILIYARTAKGYKSGGFNLRGSADPLTFAPFDPETVTDYEIGLKSDWFDRRLRANFAVYQSNYNDIQQTILAPTQVCSGTPPVCTPGTVTVVDNAAKGRVRGAEAEITVVPINGLTLRGTYSYTNAKYVEYRDLLGNDLSQQPFVYVPKVSYSLSARQEIPMDNGEAAIQVDFNHKGSITISPNSPVSGTGILASYNIVNARVSKTFIRENFDVAFFAKNLFGKKYYTGGFDFTPSGLGWSVATVGEPTVFGSEVTLRF
ncbi:MAG: TonB-dependent receptor [Sphingobium sp.]